MTGLENTDMDKLMVSELADNSGLLELTHQGIDGVALEPEIRYDIPGCEVAMVTGEPFTNASNMDFEQGDNPFNASGNCGLVSICNLLRRAGIDVSETEVTKCAIDSGLCDYNPLGIASNNGGTTMEMRRDVLNKFGVASDIYPSEKGGSLERIADAVDTGHGVLISVNAGELWECDDGSAPVFGHPVSNHCVTVTGIARDAGTGEIAGVFIADSGRGLPGDSCRYLSVEKFNAVYTDVYGSGANITRNAIMRT